MPVGYQNSIRYSFIYIENTVKYYTEFYLK